MRPAKSRGGRKTPPELDFLFARGLVEEDEYIEFWPRWWKASPNEKEEIINEYLEEDAEDFPDEPIKATLTRDKNLAQFQAELIDGYVARRNKKGRFSKRGVYYQAIRKGRKGK